MPYEQKETLSTIGNVLHQSETSLHVVEQSFSDLS